MRYRPTAARRALQLTPLAWTLLCAGIGAAHAQPFPSGGVAVQGTNVTIGTPTGGTMTVSQGSDRAIIHWGSFSLGSGNTLSFQQPGAASITLNRVGGSSASNIDGIINAPGRVFIINPSGVLFGAGSQVNVGGLVASALELAGSDAAFMAGGENFVFSTAGTASALVSNAGTLNARQGGLVALVAPQVVNTGTIQAPGGTVALGAGERVELDVGGDGLTRLIVGGARSSRVASFIGNSGDINASGGRIAMAVSGSSVSTSDYPADGIVVRGATLVADTMFQRNGEIVLDSGASASGVAIIDSALQARGDAAGARGGNIDVRGHRVLLGSQAPGDALYYDSSLSVGRGSGTLLDASGQAGGGSIGVEASAAAGATLAGGVAISQNSALHADALASGPGGAVRIGAPGSLRAYGTVSARGGANGGDGGLVETRVYEDAATSGSAAPAAMDLAGLRVDAGAASGRAGSWNIEAPAATIVHGASPADMGTDPFTAPSASAIQDSDIRYALDRGTSVGVAAVGGGDKGRLTLGRGVALERGTGNAPLALQLSAQGDILTTDSATIGSATGPMDVALQAGARGGSGNVYFAGLVYTQGGSVAMQAQGAPQASQVEGGVWLRNATIDSRAGRSDSGAGGAVRLAGNAVLLQASQLYSSSADTSLAGTQSPADGVALQAYGEGRAPSGIHTTSGNITVRGHSYGSGYAGVRLDGLAQIASASGAVELSGSHAGPQAGIRIEAPLDSGTSTGTSTSAGAAGPALSTQGNMLLRAANDGSADAIAIGRALQAGGVLNLRPGVLQPDGTVADATAMPVTLGGASAAGFAVSGDEWALLSAPAITVGSNRHGAPITVAGALATPGSLNLQAEGAGGAIVLAAPLDARQLGLLAAGDISQTAGAALHAASLLAGSAGGSVLLERAANAVDTVGGGAGGAFRYQDVDALRLGAATASGLADAAGGAPYSVRSGPLGADSVFVRTLSQDLALATDLSSRSGIDLVAAARLQNPDGHALGGAPWRVWATTWEGEARGGLGGSGGMPNLYGCSYGGSCGVAVTPEASHFIYARQPTVTVQVNDASRGVGQPDPPFGYTVTAGLVNGDTGAALSGPIASSASVSSPPGSYPIGGSLSSASGYRVNLLPGTLSVQILPWQTALPLPEFARDTPDTYTFASNLGNPPVCFAPSVLSAGVQAAPGDDFLALEWPRVRSRPSITSCIDTGRRNGCGDF